jgi:Glycosyl hydrolase family 26
MSKSAVGPRCVVRALGVALAVALTLSGSRTFALATTILRDAPDLQHELQSAAAGLAHPQAASTSTAATPLSVHSSSASAASSRAPAPARPALSLGWGVVEADWPGSAAGVAAAEATAGRKANLIETYVHWGGGWGAFAQLRGGIGATLQRGSTPVISWMSDDPTGASLTAYDLRGIAAGSWDAYARSWADGLRDLNTPILLRFDAEMNGNWMTYSPGFGGNGSTSADFVAAWRHLHDIFRTEGATKVSWVWSPNVQYPGSLPLRALYPGNAYVDWVALDGYNWGTTYGHVWQSFGQVFDPSIAAVEALTSRPLMIAETASAEAGGDKASWIAGMFSELANRRDIRGFIWFDLDKETDWRIASDPASASAFKAGLGRFTTP